MKLFSQFEVVGGGSVNPEGYLVLREGRVARVGGRGPVGGLFVFSSRRRHTRLQGDWSSDVCSSDLTPSFCLIIQRLLFQQLRKGLLLSSNIIKLALQVKR